MPLFGDPVLDSLIILLLVNLALSREIVTNLKRNLLICCLLIQYPIINLINVTLREQNEFTFTHAPANHEMWAWSCLAIFLAGAFFAPKICSRFIQYGIPVSILITFSVIAYIWVPNGGRIEPFGHPVFYAPLFGTSLVLIFIFRNNSAIESPRFIELALLGFVLVISIVFSQTRGIFIAQVVTILSVSVILLIHKKWKWVATLTGFSIIGISTILFAVSWTGNSTLSRLTSAVTATQILMTSEDRGTPITTQAHGDAVASNVAEGSAETAASDETAAAIEGAPNISAHLRQVSEQIERSGGLRLEFWAMSISKIVDRPIEGFGANHEPKFLNESGFSFTHVHNIYLSWMLWGGIITLLSGLLFIFAAPLSAMISGAPLPQKLSSMSLALLWASAMALDSFIVYEAFNYIFITFSILSFTSSIEEDKSLTT